MRPPQTLNVLDRHGGFTCESRMPGSVRSGRMDFQARKSGAKLRIGDTLWRPGSLLRGDPIGQLLAYDENSFYQTNNDVTLAVYRVPGYSYPVLIWFDNMTGERADDASAVARALRQRITRYMTEPHAQCARAGYCVEHEARPDVAPCEQGVR